MSNLVDSEKVDIINEAYSRANSIDAVRGLAYRSGHKREAEELDRARTMIFKLIYYIVGKEDKPQENEERMMGNTNGDTKQILIDLLFKEPPMVLSTAYLYAKNYVNYGEDVTEKWLTATQNACALEKAYRKGYYDALQKLVESEEEK